MKVGKVTCNMYDKGLLALFYKELFQIEKKFKIHSREKGMDKKFTQEEI